MRNSFLFPLFKTSIQIRPPSKYKLTLRWEIAKRKEKRDRKDTSLHPHTFYILPQLDIFETISDVSRETRKGKVKQLQIECYHQLDKNEYSWKKKTPIETTKDK